MAYLIRTFIIQYFQYSIGQSQLHLGFSIPPDFREISFFFLLITIIIYMFHNYFSSLKSRNTCLSSYDCQIWHGLDDAFESQKHRSFNSLGQIFLCTYNHWSTQSKCIRLYNTKKIICLTQACQFLYPLSGPICR